MGPTLRPPLPAEPPAVHTPSPSHDCPSTLSFSEHLISLPPWDPSQPSHVTNFGLGGFFTFVLFFILYREIFFSKASFDRSNFSGAVVNLFLFLIYFPPPDCPAGSHSPLSSPDPAPPHPLIPSGPFCFFSFCLFLDKFSPPALFTPSSLDLNSHCYSNKRTVKIPVLIKLYCN